MPTTTTTFLEATGTDAKRLPEAMTILIGDRRFARADLDGMRSAMDVLNERAKAAAAEARRAALVFGEAWLALRNALPKRDFDAVVGGLSINRKTLGKRIRLALRAGNGAGGWDAEKIKALRGTLASTAPTRLATDLMQHRVMSGSAEDLTVTDVEVLLGERPVGNLLGRGGQVATRVASERLDNPPTRVGDAADDADPFPEPAGFELDGPGAGNPLVGDDDADDEDDGSEADWPDQRPGRLDVAAGDTGGTASLSPCVAAATAAPTPALRFFEVKAGAAPALNPPALRPVQATFAGLYQQAERVRRFADQVQRGEVGAEHLARVMAAIGGEA